MKYRTVWAAISAVAIAAAGYYYLKPGEPSPPPDMRPDGERNDYGPITTRKTIDYETVLRAALSQKASFQTLTFKRVAMRDEYLERSIRYTPFPSSRARVRVKYDVEYSIGYALGRGDFKVSGNADEITVTLHRPQIIARPAVKLLSHQVLESGILIDEEAALLELQQSIEPEAEERAPDILNRPDVTSRSEQIFRSVLETLLKNNARGGSPPSINLQYD